MIVRNLDEIKNTSRVVHDPKGQWISHRLLLEQDGMGFSLHITEVKENCNATWEYKNHLEACYCLSGEGEIIDINGNRFPLKAGTVYALNKHDRHTVIAYKKMTLVSVFNPAVQGSEVHQADGSYPAAT
jgi:L-ectoine synthase